MRSYVDRRGVRHRAPRPRRWVVSDGRQARLRRMFILERDERRLARAERAAGEAVSL